MAFSEKFNEFVMRMVTFAKILIHGEIEGAMGH